MRSMKICKCGICIYDCDYHKPVKKTKLSKKYFTADGTWTVPEGVTKILLSTGSIDSQVYVPVKPGTSYKITIGSGGAAGLGGDTTFEFEEED
jgi:hypothetical protein